MDRPVFAMRVTRIDDDEFLVSSESRTQKTHKVEVSPSGAIIGCTCEDWYYRTLGGGKPELARPDHRCKHALAVIDYLVDHAERLARDGSVLARISAHRTILFRPEGS